MAMLWLFTVHRHQGINRRCDSERSRWLTIVCGRIADTKKLAAPLAVAAICGVAALLVAGGKSAPESTEMIAQRLVN